MNANTLNYTATAVFFAAAIRDWFFPGVFQMSRHIIPSEEGVVWFIMGCTCVVEGLTRSRRAKLLASLFLGTAFVVGSMSQMAAERQLWPGAFGLLAGAFVAWVGLQKYRKDPNGGTRSAPVL